MMDIGVMNGFRDGGKCFDHVRQFGLSVCQLTAWDVNQMTDEAAETVKRESAASGVRISALWAGYSGPSKWNFTEGPTTLGIVPREYRETRVAELKKGADFAVACGLPAIITHAGFIPENMTDPEFPGVVAALKEIADHCVSLGIGFWFETGQETPVTLLRTFERIGTDNLGINLDPANLIMYGKGNPIDALDVFGKYVRNVHVKDGLYPTDGDNLGEEVRAGTGKVRFPEFIQRLKEIGYTGELIIEREISGEQQAKDIRQTVDDLKGWIAAA